MASPVAVAPQSETVGEGVHVYIGTTGTGKTYLAIQHAFPLARSRGVGVLIVDSRGADNFRSLPVDSIEGAITKVFRQRGIAHVIPRDAFEFERLMLAADQYGNAVIIVDECATWATSKSLVLLARVWRHRRVSLFLTTQKVGRDIEQGILACDPTIYLFRVTNPRSLEWAVRWHSVPEETLRALQRGQHYRIQG